MHQNEYGAPKRWFRLYAEFATDPKVQMMSEANQRRLLMIFCLRCNGDVTLQDDVVTFQLRISGDEWGKTKAEFMRLGFIDGENKIINWDKRQFISDISNQRVKLHRDRMKRKCNVTVTPPESDTDTDTDRERKILSVVNLPESIEVSSKDSRRFENFEPQIAEWNRIAELHGLPRCQVLTTQRKAAMKARLKDCGGADGWADACRMVSESDFLTGKKTDWKASLDFMLQKKSFTKILEGAYSNHEAPTRPPKGSGDYFSGLVAAVDAQMNKKGNSDEEDYSPLGKL